MSTVSDGVESKTEKCSTAIIFGDLVQPDRLLRQGEVVTFPTFSHAKIRYDVCKSEREYTRDDLRTYLQHKE